MYRRIAVALIASLIVFANPTKVPFARASEALSYAQLDGAFRWQIPKRWFGGFSAIEVYENGQRFIALSDRGYVVEGAFSREQGSISGIYDVSRTRVLRPEGHFAKQTGWRDSEGLARFPDGNLVMSFEGEHRLERFTAPGALPREMPWHDEFDDMKVNGGFEAVAVDDKGLIFAMPEVPIAEEDAIQVYVLEDESWGRAFTLSRDKQFQPVGADIGPDGRLYILERGFNGLGFRTRARSFDISSGEATSEKLLFSRSVGKHDNLEGISVWQDNDGAIRLTMISDDNFRFLQRTEFVEYVLPISP